MVRSIALAGVAMLAVPAVAQQAAVHDIIARHIAAGDIPGAVVMAMRDGKVVVAEAQGKQGFKIDAPLKLDSVVWIASTTKPVVAVATMMLVEQGKIGVDDPISKYIPEFHDTKVRVLKPGFSYVYGRFDPKGPKLEYDVVPANRPLRVRDFLTFTSGLQVIQIPNDTWPQQKPDDTLATWVPKLGTTTLEYQPGSRWSYSNGTGFEVLARLVEIVSGQKFDKYCQEHIFDPLEMPDTAFGLRSDLKERSLPLAPMLVNNPIMMGSFVSGSAGLSSTVTDYSHFAQMWLNGGTYKGKRLLKASTIKQMAENQIGGIGLAGIDPVDYTGLQTKVTPGIKYGFGVAVITDAKAAGLPVPDGSFGWDGVGTRRWWAMPSKHTTLVMWLPEAAPGGRAAAQTHREIEAAVVAAAR